MHIYKNYISIYVLTLGLSFLILSATANSFEKSDTIRFKLRKQLKTEGVTWGGSPILAYDADLGLRYGAVINLFDYGNGKTYPDYLQYLHIKAFNTTKGNSTLTLLFDSEKLLNKSKLILESNYSNDMALGFYGFNGNKTVWNKDFVTPESSDYFNKYYYTQQRQVLSFRADVQRYITSRNIRLHMGITYNKYWIKPVNFDRLKKSKGFDGSGYIYTSLFEHYKQWQLIPKEEENGGSNTQLSLGIILDTRNKQINCSKGIWLESFVVVSPKIRNNPSFSKHVFTFRNYVKIPPTNIILSYRLSSQQKLWGQLPFYYLPIYLDTKANQDGLGGAFTMRGIFRNRIAANGYVLGNAELRKKIGSFNTRSIRWSIHVSMFTDASYITQEYKIDTRYVPPELKTNYFTNKKQFVNTSFGTGAYLIFNSNNIISINYGFTAQRQLGMGGLYIGSTLLF